MRARHIAVLIGAAGLMVGAAGVAQAADGSRGVDFTVRAEPVSSPVVSGKTVNLDARRGRWGVTLNMQQPDTRQSTLNDVAAGAYFRITPSLRVGGAVALGDQQLQPGARTPTPDEGQPRVRLETKFKF